MSQSGSFQIGAGGAPIETLTGNSGGAVGPNGSGNITLVGDGEITVVGNPGANELSIELTNGTDGQLLIGGGAAAAWASLTSTGGTVTITPGANTLNIEAAASPPTTFTADVGSATPAANTLVVAGGANINTSGAADTLTINLNDSIALNDTNASGSEGLYSLGGTRFLHNFGTDNIFAGSGSGNLTLSGTVNTGIGTDSLASLTTGASNTAVGSSTLSANTDGNENVALGSAALFQNVSGSRNVALGFSAIGLLNTANDLVGVGYHALRANTSGSDNVAAGSRALESNTTGSRNVAVGVSALSDMVGNADSTAVGYNALLFTTGARNTAIGSKAMDANVGGADNIAIGDDANGANITGNSNVALGSGALDAITSGSFNIAIGDAAGSSLATSDSSNILISNAGTATDVNTIRIGTQGVGNGQQDTTFIAGIHNVTPAGTNEIVIIDQNHQLGSTDVIDVANGGTGASTLTDHGVLVGSGTGAITPLAVGTDGQVLLGSTGADPVFATLTSTGATITFTPGAGTLNLEAVASGGGMTWNNETTATLAMAVNNGYVATSTGGSLLTATLPTTAAVGDRVAIAGVGSGGWRIAQNASEIIHFGDQNTTTGVGGYLEFTNRYDSVELVCVVADTEWVVRSSVGNITVV
jgi:hypothetical protein